MRKVGACNLPPRWSFAPWRSSFPRSWATPTGSPFEGVLTLVDVPSDKAPSGSRGHRVVLTRDAAEAALPSLLGMAVDYKAGWDGHDARQKCGIITAAQLNGKQLAVAGYLFAATSPRWKQKIQIEGAMGMSYELADAHVADMRAPIWTLTKHLHRSGDPAPRTRPPIARPASA